MKNTNLKDEWLLLQTQFDSYEKHSLYIKLSAVFVLLLCFAADVVGLYAGILLLVLWLQDGIWKTFQSRIEIRLLQLEKAIEDGSMLSACQFNSEYQKNCFSGVALIAEYIRQALRPTVAFPYVVLVAVCFYNILYSVLNTQG